MKSGNVKYYLMQEREILAKGYDFKYWIYDFDKREWILDTKNIISDALMGFDDSEPEDSPYRIGNTSVMAEIKEIPIQTAQEIISDITVRNLLEKWREKFKEAKKEWDEKPLWPAKHVETKFVLNGRVYTICPEDLGFQFDPWDEGFMESIQKDLEKDLLAVGAMNVSHSGFLD